MNRASDQFFAGAAFADDYDRRVRRRNLFDRRYNASHRERLPNKRLMRSRWYQAPGQMLVFPTDAKICVHLQDTSPLAVLSRARPSSQRLPLTSYYNHSLGQKRKSRHNPRLRRFKTVNYALHVLYCIKRALSILTAFDTQHAPN